MRERLAQRDRFTIVALTGVAAVALAGCSNFRSPARSETPTPTPKPTSSLIIADRVDLQGQGTLFKSKDLSNGQECYVVILQGTGNAAGISCPVNSK